MTLYFIRRGTRNSWFSFSENGIIVSNDDGGIPWEGNFDDVGYIDSYTGGLKVEGPIIDGKDAAQLFLKFFGQ